MKVVLRSSSLFFTLLSIVFNAPINRVKSEHEEEECDRASGAEPRAIPDGRGGLTAEPAYHMHPRPRG